MAKLKTVMDVNYMMIAKICCASRKNVEFYLDNFQNLIATMLLDKMEINVIFLKIVLLDIVLLIIAMEI